MKRRAHRWTIGSRRGHRLRRSYPSRRGQLWDETSAVKCPHCAVCICWSMRSDTVYLDPSDLNNRLPVFTNRSGVCPAGNRCRRTNRGSVPRRGVSSASPGRTSPRAGGVVVRPSANPTESGEQQTRHPIIAHRAQRPARRNPPMRPGSEPPRDRARPRPSGRRCGTLQPGAPLAPGGGRRMAEQASTAPAPGCWTASSRWTTGGGASRPAFEVPFRLGPEELWALVYVLIEPRAPRTGHAAAVALLRGPLLGAPVARWQRAAPNLPYG